MKNFIKWYCIVWLTTFSMSNCSKGFKVLSSGARRGIMKSEEFKGGLPDALGSFGGLGSLVTMNYNRPAKDVIIDMGNAIIPIISVGLSLIPGGALISGLVTGVWSLISGLFGGGPSISPMQMLVDNINEELTNIKKHINQVAKEIIETTRRETDEKLKSMVERLIKGEMRRNKYVCSKYALISRDFSDALQNNKTVPESLRIEMLAYIQDCDNFLKDTVEAFIYPEYADILWIPSIITTLARVSFLTEVSNYGYSLNIDKSILHMFWEELKADIQAHFSFAIDSVKIREKSVRFLGNFTPTEYAGCQLQKEIFFLDREMYPYGVPQSFKINGTNNLVNLADFNITDDERPRHLLIYYNEIGQTFTNRSNVLLNCIFGGDIIIRVRLDSMSFRVKYIHNKLYQIRVVYFIKNIEVDPRRLNFKVHEGNNNLDLTLAEHNETSIKRFITNVAFLHMWCTRKRLATGWPNHEDCYSAKHFSSGLYIVENVVAFKVSSDAEMEGIISIDTTDELIEDNLLEDVVFLGVELIILPGNFVET